jgi:hypothetical protein
MLMVERAGVEPAEALSATPREEGAIPLAHETRVPRRKGTGELLARVPAHSERWYPVAAIRRSSAISRVISPK